jgi:hypothetical protein
MSKRRILVPFKKRTHDHAECIDSALVSAQSSCERQGLRLTKLRRRVLELVWRGHTPVKAYDILEELRKEDRAAAPPTVYRALDFLLNAGLVHRIESLSAFVGCGGPAGCAPIVAGWIRRDTARVSICSMRAAGNPQSIATVRGHFGGAMCLYISLY